MEYYSQKAYELIREKFIHLKGEELFFDEIKQKLYDIVKRPSAFGVDKFFILFVSTDLREVQIKDFFNKNQIPFDFEEYRFL